MPFQGLGEALGDVLAVEVGRHAGREPVRYFGRCEAPAGAFGEAARRAERVLPAPDPAEGSGARQPLQERGDVAALSLVHPGSSFGGSGVFGGPGGVPVPVGVGLGLAGGAVGAGVFDGFAEDGVGDRVGAVFLRVARGCNTGAGRFTRGLRVRVGLCAGGVSRRCVGLSDASAAGG
ncbi:hypothetical protein AB0H37_24915 [Actinomadura sp. NPDC023710]|uniref:hypothetical protein n=1 Tax=Actinomadura sp. NPDC023710 TaxID=3158219 RepID=UPI0033F6063A